MIHYISPYRSDGDIGRANNEAIARIPNDDWVCLTDGDVTFLTPDYGKQIEDIIARHGNTYHLIGCTTNRLGILDQCHGRKFSEDFDVRNHGEIAKKLQRERYSDVDPIQMVAAMFMLFQAKTYRSVGGFNTGTHLGDWYFNKALIRKGMRIGIARGLYVFHCYRMWQIGHQEAWNDITHLKKMA